MIVKNPPAISMDAGGGMGVKEATDRGLDFPRGHGGVLLVTEEVEVENVGAAVAALIFGRVGDGPCVRAM